MEPSEGRREKDKLFTIILLYAEHYVARKLVNSNCKAVSGIIKILVGIL
jgi:hypothetical protein